MRWAMQPDMRDLLIEHLAGPRRGSREGSCGALRRRGWLEVSHYDAEGAPVTVVTRAGIEALRELLADAARAAARAAALGCSINDAP